MDIKIQNLMLISNPFCHVFNGFEMSIKVSFFTPILNLQQKNYAKCDTF
jgi:hypothetical protein